MTIEISDPSEQLDGTRYVVSSYRPWFDVLHRSIMNNYQWEVITFHDTGKRTSDGALIFSRMKSS